MPRDSFDVYYYQGGRWSLHASYEANQRDEAIGEAMGVESKLGYPARVVRETFHSDSNTSNASVTWQSAKAKKLTDSDDMFGSSSAKPAGKATGGARRAAPAGAVSRPMAPAGGGKPAPVKNKPAPVKNKVKKKGRSVFVDLAIAIIISSVVAVAMAAGIALLTLQLQKSGTIGRFDSSPLIFGSFILTFFIGMLVQLNKIFNLFATLRATTKSSPSAQPPAHAAPQRMVRRKVTPQDIEFTGVAVERGNEPDPAATETPLETAALEGQEPEAPTSLNDESATSAAPPASEAPQAAPQTAPPEPEQPHSPPAAPEPQTAPEPKQARPDDDARATFAAFISESMAVAQRDVGQFNAVTKMGFNLFLSGGMATLGSAKRLNRESQITVLKQGLQAAGNSAERAASFATELPSYGKNPRYTGMIHAGAKAMEGHLSGQPEAAGTVGPLLSDWALPEKRPTAPQVFTFMFTDMVGSTAITQELGNAEAQKIVRAHNNVVRSALAQHKGREVKHTGDGIMAVFGDAPSAVMAAVQMQRDFLEYNQSFPELPLTIRIGLNAGEAVQEENDFFGNAVQMSARVCAQCANGNVWVSQSVVDGCQGLKLGFIPRGRFQMKGIQGARALYEVGWTDAHRNELADL